MGVECDSIVTMYYIWCAVFEVRHRAFINTYHTIDKSIRNLGGYICFKQTGSQASIYL